MIVGKEDLEPDEASDERRYTTDEVRAALEALDQASLAKLRGISSYLARTAGTEGDELWHEACLRMLTTRSCPVDVDVAAYAINTMRSIASTAYRKRKKDTADGVVHVTLAANDGGTFDIPDDEVSSEDAALARIYHGESLARIDAAIADDEHLQFLVAGICDGIFGQELEKFVGTDTKGLAAARKRLARHLKKAFPEGAPFEQGTQHGG